MKSRTKKIAKPKAKSMRPMAKSKSKTRVSPNMGGLSLR